MKRTVVYISGPITGVQRYWEAFEKVSDDLSSRGYVAFNPATLPDGMNTREYMRLDLNALMNADAVVMLPGWRHSEGATIEHNLAEYIGIPVFESVSSFAEVFKVCQN